MHTANGTAPAQPSLLERLGALGLGNVEPVVLAALFSEEPLLLLGPHGTGKSYLLERLARALGLEWRFYNASLLNYDDLVGFPLPDDRGGLRYVQTPASIWGARAVFFDEISRCRIDLQNKLFPIIHERRVQGLPLEGLVYRWSAMNPPPRDNDEPGRGYRGSEALDLALADRFAFVVAMPAWEDMSEPDQERIILAGANAICPDAARALRGTVASGKALLPGLRGQLEGNLAVYVRALTALLRKAGCVLSPRRAGMLLRNIVSVHAARLLAAPDTGPRESALLALTHSLPQRATEEGVPDRIKLLAAHREAWQSAQLEPGDPRRALLLEPDPVRRALWAARLDSLPPVDFSTMVADALADLPVGGRHALAYELFTRGRAGRLVAAVAEQCAQLYAVAASPQELSEATPSGGGRHRTWQRVVAELSKLDRKDPDTAPLTNLLVGLFAAGKLTNHADVDCALGGWQKVRERAREVVP